MRHPRFGWMIAGAVALGLGLWAEGCLFAPDACTDLLKCPGNGGGGGGSSVGSTGGAATVSGSTSGVSGSTSEVSAASSGGAPGSTSAAVSSGTDASCLVDGDCSPMTKCDPVTHTCYGCSDGLMNGNETAVDCGGDCKSCNGTMCLDAAVCSSGNCVDGRCCDTACAGVCMVCNYSPSVGTCTFTPRGGLDSVTCPDATQACDGAGVCKKASGQSCQQASVCGSGVCFAGLCRVHTGDNCTEDVACGSGRCVMGKCADCSVGADCQSNACTAPTCKAPGGAPCEMDTNCAGNQCKYGLCQDDINTACTSGSDCLSRFCSGGTCKACSNNADCPGGSCGSAPIVGYNVCKLPLGAFCSTTLPPALGCNSGMCKGFPLKCN
ncbi:MAG: hypothetical protein ABJE95_04765 [Byssovorax sp.]